MTTYAERVAAIVLIWGTLSAAYLTTALIDRMRRYDRFRRRRR